MSIRIVIADDHQVVLKGLVQYFLEEPDFEVVAECRNGEEALEAVRRFRPDVLVLDLRMPGKDGLQVLRELREEEKRPATVLLTGNVADDDVVEAMHLGVAGVVLKEMAPALLIQCVRKVHSGGTWIEKESISRAIEKIMRKESVLQQMHALLTPRELEIVIEVAAGGSNQEIARKLFISEGTVKTHLHSIYEKLNLKGRMQLLLFAREQGLVASSRSGSSGS
ncbi:MAG: response regulator transcription factor [Thermoanaerobaculia bacterium]